jgi:hypothetical protein
MVAVLLVDVGCGDLHSTKDPAMDLYIIQMSKLILQSADFITLQIVCDCIWKNGIIKTVAVAAVFRGLQSVSCSGSCLYDMNGYINTLRYILN